MKYCTMVERKSMSSLQENIVKKLQVLEEMAAEYCRSVIRWLMVIQFEFK